MPLAHILAPLIAKKAEEIQAQLDPTPVGYLDAGNVSSGTNAAGPPSGQPLPNASTPFGVMRNAMIRAYAARDQSTRKAALGNGGFAYLTPIPNAKPNGYTSVADASATIGKGRAKGKMVLPADTGPRINEYGEPVDAKGKPTGYLQQGDIRTADMRAGDVHPKLAWRFSQSDPLSMEVLQSKYGPHLQAMQDNRDKDGMPTDQFPPGYFDGKSELERKDIEDGVNVLRALDHQPMI